jgi:methionyl-tRNA formyltransferase
VLLSVAAPEPFRAAALRAAPHVLNVHNGRLPDFRGMLPTFWALHRGDDEIVVTVHEMAEAPDAGRVVAEFPVAVSEGESQFSVSVRAKLVAGERVARLLGTVDTPAWPKPHPIDPGAGGYNGFPGRREARELRAVGRRLL